MKWVETNLGAVSLGKPQYGANASSVESSGKRPRFVRITDIDDNGVLRPDCRRESDLENIESYRLEDGDFLFARTGSVGRTYVYRKSDGDCIFAGYLIRFRLNRDLIHPRFLFHYSKSPAYRQWVATKQRVAIQANINGSEYASLRFPLPTPREQGRIVELLEQADELRRQRAEADQVADRILPALFHKMFGDPAANPKGWPRTKLGDLLESIDSGWSPVCENRQAALDEWAVLKLGAVTSNRYLESENKALPSTLEPLPEFEVRAGDLLFTRKNTYELVGACAYVRSTRPKLMLSDIIFRLNLRKDAEIHPLYLWALLIYPSKRPAIQMLAGGSAGSMPNISKGRLETLEIEKPPHSLQSAFARAVSGCDSLRDNAREARDNIESLFATMLHRAFTGKLTAKWREAHLKELLLEMEHQAKLLRTAAETN